MKMKSKPNTAQFKGLKDPDAFLEGAEADRTEKPLSASEVLTTSSTAIALPRITASFSTLVNKSGKTLLPSNSYICPFTKKESSTN